MGSLHLQDLVATSVVYVIVWALNRSERVLHLIVYHTFN